MKVVYNEDKDNYTITEYRDIPDDGEMIVDFNWVLKYHCLSPADEEEVKRLIHGENKYCCTAYFKYYSPYFPILLHALLKKGITPLDQWVQSSDDCILETSLTKDSGYWDFSADEKERVSEFIINILEKGVFTGKPFTLSYGISKGIKRTGEDFRYKKDETSSFNLTFFSDEYTNTFITFNSHIKTVLELLTL